jgi:DUF438 domain-containing protein
VDGKTAIKISELLDRQAALYNEVKASIQAGTRAMSGMDAAAAEKSLQAEERAIEKIKKLEDEKNRLFDQLYTEAGFKKGEKVALKTVLGKCGPEAAAKLEKSLAALINVMRETEALNSGSAHMLKNLLEFDGFSKILKNKMTETGGTTYDSKSKAAVKRGGSGSFDIKI